MSNDGFLDIWVEGGERPVKLRTRGPDACWVDLTPEQAIDVATELLSCVRAIRLPHGIPAARSRPLVTTAAPVTPRRKIGNGGARKLQVSSDDKPPPKFSAAAQWLKSMLATGPVPVAKLKQEAAAAGHAWATVRRAGDEFGVTSQKAGFDVGWAWRLPGDLPSDHAQEQG